MVQLSIVVPTFNEASHIREFLADLERHLVGRDYEVVVVDDDSPDGTHRVLAEYAAAHPRVVPVLRTHERGLATAVIEGLRRSRGAYAVVMDSDYQHPPEIVPLLHDAALREGADCVVGSRYAPGGGVEGFPVVRRVISWGARMLAVLGLPVVRRFKVRDPMTGFFLVRRDRVPVEALKPRGYKILIEVLARSPFERVVEVGYVFRARRAGESKLRMRTQLDYFLHVSSLALKDRENRRLLMFMLVGATGIVVNLAILALVIDYYAWGTQWVVERGGQEYLLGSLAAGVVSREVAILWNFGWNDRLTFHHERRQAHFAFVHRLVRFHVVSLWSMLVYVAIFYPLVHVDVHYLLAAFLAILAGFFTNYVGNLKWTYARRREVHDQ